MFAFGNERRGVMTVRIECVWDGRARLGEGAFWDHEAGVLWWVDIKAGVVNRFDPENRSNTCHDFGEPVGCVAPRRDGGLILAGRTGFHFFDPASGAREALFDPEPELEGNRFNDGGTDPRGRFWAGTMRDDGAPPQRRGRFYRYNGDGTASAYFDPFFTTNGLAFSPAGDIMYVADTNRDVRSIWAVEYDLDAGEPGATRLFFDTNQVAGRPDGAAVDQDGCYWMAGFGGWQVVRITPSGKVDRIVDVPVERPTKVAFGGAGLDTLYLTSMGEGCKDDPDQPQAGGLFAITGLGTAGVAQARYAG